MLEKLKQVEEQFKQLTEKMADPEIISDHKKYQELARKRADLEEIVEVFSIYKKKTQELEEAKEILEQEDDEELREMAQAEKAELEKDLEKLKKKLQVLLLPKDPYDDKNVIMEIRAGTGGDEAALFAADLFRMYSKYIEKKGWKLEIISANETEMGGFKEVIFQLSGDKVYRYLKFESGGHRVQRIPVTESGGRIHTSAVTVAVLPEADEVDIQIDPKDLKIDVFRSSGPGGQSVNTTDSAVRVTHLPTGIVVSCQDEKSQHKNKAKALKVLRARLLDMELEKQQKERADSRKKMIGSGDRSERIRTYNFPQNRVTDHRINLTLYKLDAILDGDMDELINALLEHEQTLKLEELKVG